MRFWAQYYIISWPLIILTDHPWCFQVFQEEDPSAFPSLQRQGDLRNDFLIPEGDEGDEDDEEEEDIEDDRIS